VRRIAEIEGAWPTEAAVGQLDTDALQNAGIDFGQSQRSRRRFSRAASPPWIVEEQPACSVVRDHNGSGARLCLFQGRVEPALSFQIAEPR
jgi:hypothetical protein